MSKSDVSPLPRLRFEPLTPARWPSAVELFGPRGACAGCWCMYWRQTRVEFEKCKGEVNQRRFHKLVQSGPPPGILAFAGAEPVGWCAVGPRESYATLERSRALKRVDDQAVWAIVCLFVKRGWRRRGVSVGLIRAAVAFVKAQGGRLVESYPTCPRMETIPDAFAFTGLPEAFSRAGFVEVAAPSASRRIMRCAARAPSGPRARRRAGAVPQKSGRHTRSS